MKRHNKGRKTPGGVFIALLRQNPDVDQNELEKIIDNHSQFWGLNFRRFSLLVKLKSKLQ